MIDRGARVQQHVERKPHDESEQHARRRRDHGGEHLAGRRVAEQEHGVLQALVEEAPGDPAEDVADAGTQEEPDQRAVGTGPYVSADLEPGQRAGQDQEQTEAFDEDHWITDLRSSSFGTSWGHSQGGKKLRPAA